MYSAWPANLEARAAAEVLAVAVSRPVQVPGEADRRDRRRRPQRMPFLPSRPVGRRVSDGPDGDRDCGIASGAAPAESRLVLRLTLDPDKTLEHPNPKRVLQRDTCCFRQPTAS